eukprot:1877127-Rhodomonas_salina.2
MVPGGDQGAGRGCTCVCGLRRGQARRKRVACRRRYGPRPTVLRAQYAESGTGEGYAATVRTRSLGAARDQYAEPGTELGYGATRGESAGADRRVGRGGERGGGERG